MLSWNFVIFYGMVQILTRGGDKGGFGDPGDRGIPIGNLLK